MYVVITKLGRRLHLRFKCTSALAGRRTIDDRANNLYIQTLQNNPPPKCHPNPQCRSSAPPCDQPSAVPPAASPLKSGTPRSCAALSGPTPSRK